MEALVDANHPYEREERHPLDLVSETGSRECHCLPRSQSFGRVHNGGTVGEWIGIVEGWLVAMLT